MYRVCVCVSRCTYHKMIIIYQLLVIISYATTIFIIIFFFRFFSNSFHACLKKIESLKKNQQFEKLKKVFFWRNYWISWNSNKFNSTVQYTHNKHNLKRWIFQIVGIKRVFKKNIFGTLFSDDFCCGNPNRDTSLIKFI